MSEIVIFHGYYFEFGTKPQIKSNLGIVNLFKNYLPNKIDFYVLKILN